jgi:hypothetical protein
MLKYQSSMQIDWAPQFSSGRKRAERIPTRLISIEPTGCFANGLAINNLRKFTNLRNIRSPDVVVGH